MGVDPWDGRQGESAIARRRCTARRRRRTAQRCTAQRKRTSVASCDGACPQCVATANGATAIGAIASGACFRSITRVGFGCVWCCGVAVIASNRHECWGVLPGKADVDVAIRLTMQYMLAVLCDSTLCQLGWF